MTALLAAWVVAACAPISPAFDAGFGKSVPRLAAQQTANPDAPIENRNRTVDGMDGRAAREAMERYYNSFRVPPPPVNTFTIGVGTGSAPATQ